LNKSSELNLHYLDIRAQREDDGQLLLRDRGYLFGDGFFTTGIVNNGLLQHPAAHWQRLQESGQTLKFLSIDWPRLIGSLNNRLLSEGDACIRISVSRSQSARGYKIDQRAAIHVSVILSALPQVPSGYCDLFFAETPASSNPLLAGLKHLNRLDSVLAASEINSEQAGNQESLLCLDDSVICGSRSNLFMLSKGVWLTPRLDRAGVSGITRNRLIKAMQLHRIPVKEGEISRQQLLDCDAALITNSLLGIWSAQKIQGRLLATQLADDLKYQLNFQR